MRLLTRGLATIHRYLGILLSLMFVVWFASAFVMIYAGGMPKITPQMRIEGASAPVLTEVGLSVADASLHLGYSPTEVTLRSILGRPVYDFSVSAYATDIVYADTGELYGSLKPGDGALIAADFLGIDAALIKFEALVADVDQWTLTLVEQAPFYRYQVADDGATEVYVSVPLGQVAVYTTRSSRTLAWLGTVPHWLYFAALRLNQPLWYDLVVWLAAIGSVLAGLGLVLGLIKWRRTRPFELKKAIPYRGVMRWHYILGISFGIVGFTWVFSGLLSMEPFAWTRQQGIEIDSDLYQQGEFEPDDFVGAELSELSTVVPGTIKELSYRRILGRPYFQVSYTASDHSMELKRERLHQPYYIQGQAEADRILIDAVTLSPAPPFDPEQLTAIIATAVDGASVTESELISDYDAYYYSRGGQLPLPVLRVKFDDPALSWVYIDPRDARLLSLIHRYSRIERWLYNGLHSLDFAFWYHKRPLWDLVLLFLLTGGLVSSLLASWLGFGHLVQDLRRATRFITAIISRRSIRVS